MLIFKKISRKMATYDFFNDEKMIFYSKIGMKMILKILQKEKKI